MSTRSWMGKLPGRSREPSGRLDEVVDGEAARQVEGAVGPADDSHYVAVGLVVDLAHDLLEQVLDRHDALAAAVLVHHDRHVLAALAHDSEGIESLDALGEHERGMGDGADPAAPGDQVPEVHHSGDAIQVGFGGGGGAREAGFDQPAQCLLGRQVLVQHEHVAAGGEDLAQRPLGDVERPRDDPPLVRGEALEVGDDVTHLLLGDFLAAPGRVAAEQPHDQVGRLRQQPHDGPGDLGDERQRPGDEEAPALGPLHGEALGCQLAHDQREVGDEQRDDHHRRRIGGAPHETDIVGQGLGEGHRPGRRCEEARQGYHDLDGGEEPIGIPGQLGQRLARPAPGGEPPELALP